MSVQAVRAQVAPATRGVQTYHTPDRDAYDSDRDDRAYGRLVFDDDPESFTNVEATNPASTPARHVGTPAPGTAGAPSSGDPSWPLLGASASLDVRPARQTRPSGS